MQLRLIGIALGLAGSVACTGRGDTGRRPDTDPIDTDPGIDTAIEDVQGFIVRGVALDLETGAPVPEGLCVHAVNPAPVLLGGDPEILLSSTIRAEGRYGLPGIQTDSSIGILIMVEDCDGQPDTVFRTATGVASEDYKDVPDGTILADRTAWSVATPYAATIDASLDQVGSTKHMADGVMLGFVQVEADLQPIGGATVGESSAGTFYADTNPADGLFGAGAVANTQTDAAARAMYIMPGAGVKTYQAEDGGAHTFTSRLSGSFAGFAVFIAWLGE